MSECSHFPLRQPETVIALITEYVLTPICFGTGIVGCLCVVLVMNRAEMRRENATNVFLTSLAVMDLLTLISSLPASLRLIEVFPLDVSYSFSFTLISTIASAVHEVSKHTCYWTLALALMINYSNQPDISKSKSPRWTRISASRLLAFLNVLFTAIIDIPSIVELRIQLVETISLIGLPLFLIVIFSLVTLLLTAAARGRMSNTMERPIIFAKRPIDQEERRSQQNATLVATSIAFITLRVPYHYYYTEWFAIRDSGSIISSIPNSISKLSITLYIISITSQFLIYAIFNNDFLVTFKRMFCCLCKAGDLYVESPSCFACCGNKTSKEDFSIEKKRSTSKTTVQPPIRHNYGLYNTLGRPSRASRHQTRRGNGDVMYATLDDPRDNNNRGQRHHDPHSMRCRSLPRRPCNDRRVPRNRSESFRTIDRVAYDSRTIQPSRRGKRTTKDHEHRRTSINSRSRTRIDRETSPPLEVTSAVGINDESSLVGSDSQPAVI